MYGHCKDVSGRSGTVSVVSSWEEDEGTASVVSCIESVGAQRGPAVSEVLLKYKNRNTDADGR